MINILIIGSSGFIGKSLLNKLKLSKGLNIYSAVRKEHELEDNERIVNLNIEELSNIESFIYDHSIGVIINCVAISNVEECEKNYEYAREVNVNFAIKLVRIANKYNAKLIHFSTNAVYCGDESPYNEQSQMLPKNKYGHLKALADNYIVENCNKYTIARIMTVYGKRLSGTRTNPSEFIIDRLKENSEIYLVNDVYNNMLYIDDLMVAIEKIILLDLIGVYNISGDEIMNRYEFGCNIAKILGMSSSKLHSCTSEKFGSLASRAFNTSFDNSKIKADAHIHFTPLNKAIKKAYK